MTKSIKRNKNVLEIAFGLLEQCTHCKCLFPSISNIPCNTLFIPKLNSWCKFSETNFIITHNRPLVFVYGGLNFNVNWGFRLVHILIFFSFKFDLVKPRVLKDLYSQLSVVAEKCIQIDINEISRPNAYFFVLKGGSGGSLGSFRIAVSSGNWPQWTLTTTKKCSPPEMQMVKFIQIKMIR